MFVKNSERLKSSLLDVSACEDVEQKLREALEREHAARELAEKVVHQRDEVLSTVSHDLRTPLTAIKLYANLIRRHGEGGAAESAARRIEQTVDSMSKLISDLLDCARIEAGKLVMCLAPENADSIVADAIAAIAPIAAQKGIALTASGVCPQPILCDHDRLTQVFSNVLGNAVKFTPEGGRVHLEMISEDDFVLFRISDTGPGIPEEQVEHIFERFWKARPSGSKVRKGEGSGLGLSIAKAIVSAHNGTIWAENISGAGAVISFRLPLL